MRFWFPKAQESDPEIAMDTLPNHPHELSEFEVVIDSPIVILLKSLWKHVKSPFKSLNHSLKALDKWEKMIFLEALVFNCICAVYQSVDSFYKIYPGSKAAANILRSSKTSSVWDVFYIIFTYFTLIVDCGLVFIVYRMATSRAPRWFAFYLGMMIVGIPLIGGAPIYVKYLIRSKWNAVAFANACDGWDLDILVQGTAWTGFKEGLPSVGWATIKTSGALYYSMSLQRDAINHEIYTSHLNETSNALPPYNSINYNITSTTCNVSNHTDTYITTPHLSFPSLGLVLRDNSIPFTRPSDTTYPPSADLVYRNRSMEANVLSTKVANLRDCTMLKVCGMRAWEREIEIALGVVLIEMFKASVYCTKPSNETVTL